MGVTAERWPLVLCGPMLRRVEPTIAAAGQSPTQPGAVSVFVALKHARRVTLTLYRLPGDGAAGPAERLHAEDQATTRLGTYLHAAVVTITPPQGLEPGVTYAYDLTFTRTASTDPLDVAPGMAEVSDLRSLGLLDGAAATLGYARDELPTFAVAPGDLARLRIVHASCRLPHAERADALATLDHVVAATRRDPHVRPHQLFLTGDQIYADDVEPSMLHLAGAVGAAALGWPAPERVPTAVPATEQDPDGGASITHFAFAPTRRAALLAARAGVTSTRSHSHLLALAEFVGMYLLVWSDALWPRAGDDVVLPEESELFAHPEWGADPKARGEAARLFGERRRELREFAAAVPRVRRALANVPTCTAFDDHEVTDDWYLSRHWADRMHALPMGMRLLQNALAAYAVFQAWGNNPAQFAPDRPGAALLAALGSWTGADDAQGAAVRQALGLPPDGDGPRRLRWDYQLDCLSHQVIVLDSRTRRGFPAGDPRGAAALLGPEAMEEQITARLSARRRAVPLTVVVAPAPIFGHPFVEEVAQPLGTLVFNSAPWLVGMRAGENETDREAWCFNKPAFEDLLRRLADFGQVLILSGDVHYGFTAMVEYWDRRGPSPEVRRARFVQCTASGLKNEDGKTRNLSRDVVGGAFKGVVAEIPVGDQLRTASYAGWAQPGSHLALRGAPVFVAGTPAVHKFPSRWADAVRDAPQWQYRVSFAEDRDADRPTLVAYPAGYPPRPPSNASAAMARAYEHAAEHRRRHKVEQQRRVVGNNNFGDVTFEWRPDFAMVRHSFWYNIVFDERAAAPAPPARPLSTHVVPISPLGADAPEPLPAPR